MCYAVDNSAVAEDHCHQWQQICKEEDGEDHCLLCSIAAVRAPRYASSVDDVRAQYTNGY